MKRFLLSGLLLSFMLTSTVAIADDASEPLVAPLRQSQKAPFSGLLLNPPAAAKIIVDYNNIKTQVEIETTKAVEIEKAKAKKTIDDLKTELEYTKTVADAITKSREKQVDVLLQKVNDLEKNRSDPALWCGIGVASGVVVTVLTILVIGAAK
jgi:hypothetical protein